MLERTDAITDEVLEPITSVLTYLTVYLFKKLLSRCVIASFKMYIKIKNTDIFKVLSVFCFIRIYIVIYIYENVAPYTCAPVQTVFVIQNVPGGTCQTSGECSLGQTIPI